MNSIFPFVFVVGFHRPIESGTTGRCGLLEEVGH